MAHVYVAKGYMPQGPPSQGYQGGWNARNQNSVVRPTQGQGTNPNFPNRCPPQYSHPYPPQNPYHSFPPPYFPLPQYPPNPFYPPPPPYYPPSSYPPPSQQNLHPQGPPQKPPVDDNLATFLHEAKLAREAQDATIKRLETAVGQISGTMNLIQQSHQTRRIPSQGIQPQQAHEVQHLIHPFRLNFHHFIKPNVYRC